MAVEVAAEQRLRPSSQAGKDALLRWTAALGLPNPLARIQDRLFLRLPRQLRHQGSAQQWGDLAWVATQVKRLIRR